MNVIYVIFAAKGISVRIGHMLVLIHSEDEKASAQRMLEARIKNKLRLVEKRNIGFPSGNVDLKVHSRGKTGLWVAFGGRQEAPTTERYWNLLGLDARSNGSIPIVVEFNIPTKKDTAAVAGFFARDLQSGKIYMMHSGRVGGGRIGVGKSAFLAYSRLRLSQVALPNGGLRFGIPVACIDDNDIDGRIEYFVRRVKEFKEAVRDGLLVDEEFKGKIEIYEEYSPEFSGLKTRRPSAGCEYLCYHGDIVDEIYRLRSVTKNIDESISNSPLIDLFVTLKGSMTELYEVKTGIDRQDMYTGIGQLLVHSTEQNNLVKKILVLPNEVVIPEDLLKAIARLKIDVMRFQLQISGGVARVRIMNG